MFLTAQFVECIIIAVSAIFLLLSVVKDREVCSPYVAFNIVWLLVGLMLLFGNSQIFQPSVLATTIVLVGVIGFNISVLIPRITINGKRLLVKEEERVFLAGRCQMLAIVMVLCWVFVSMSSIGLLLSGSSLSDVRESYYSTDTGPAWLYYVKNYFLLPGTDAVIVASIISFIRQEKKSRLLLACTVLLVLLRAISSGGRYILINTLLMVVCALALFKALSNMPRKKKCALYFSLIVFALLIVVFTNERTTANTESLPLFEKLYLTTYTYFSGSVTFLGELMATVPQIEGSTGIACFIGGFLGPVFTVLSFLKIMPYPDFMNIIGIYACAPLAIGPSTYYNAMPTAFGYFFIDGGLIAVFIESLIFGYICNRTYRVAQTGDALVRGFYIMLFVQICMISTRWFFFTSDSALAFFFLLFLFRPLPKKKIAPSKGLIGLTTLDKDKAE